MSTHKNSQQLSNMTSPPLFEQCFKKLQNCSAQASPAQIYEKVQKIRFIASGRKYITLYFSGGIRQNKGMS